MHNVCVCAWAGQDVQVESSFKNVSSRAARGFGGRGVRCDVHRGSGEFVLTVFIFFDHRAYHIFM